MKIVRYFLVAFTAAAAVVVAEPPPQQETEKAVQVSWDCDNDGVVDAVAHRGYEIAEGPPAVCQFNTFMEFLGNPNCPKDGSVAVPMAASIIDEILTEAPAKCSDCELEVKALRLAYEARLAAFDEYRIRLQTTGPRYFQFESRLAETIDRLRDRVRRHQEGAIPLDGPDEVFDAEYNGVAEDTEELANAIGALVSYLDLAREIFQEVEALKQRLNAALERCNQEPLAEDQLVLPPPDELSPEDREQINDILERLDDLNNQLSAVQSGLAEDADAAARTAARESFRQALNTLQEITRQIDAVFPEIVGEPI